MNALKALRFTKPAAPQSEPERRQADTFGRLSGLPRFHPNAGRLLGITSESENGLEELETLFRSDPALTADLLLTANSVEFGRLSRVSSIRSALAFLGVDRSRSLALTIVMRRYTAGVDHAAIRPILLHAVATAVIAEKLCRMNRFVQPDSYTAGLMHDVGRLGLMLSGAQYASFLSVDEIDFAESNRVEKTRFGMDHCEAGVFLAKTWGFPPALNICIEHHHGPMATCNDLLGIVQMACGLAGELGFGELHLKNEENAAENSDGGLLAQWELDSEELCEEIMKYAELAGAK